MIQSLIFNTEVPLLSFHSLTVQASAMLVSGFTSLTPQTPGDSLYILRMAPTGPVTRGIVLPMKALLCGPICRVVSTPLPKAPFAW